MEQEDRRAHREWIGGRVLTLLSHYWREDDDEMLTEAIAADWADVLEGLPQHIIQRACVQYQRDEPRRKPTPGAVYQLAVSMMPKRAPTSTARPMTAEERKAHEERRSKAREINPERKAQAERIMAQVGFAMKKGDAP